MTPARPNACLMRWRKTEPFACRFRKHSGPRVLAWSPISLGSNGTSNMRNPNSATWCCAIALTLLCMASGAKAEDAKAAKDEIQRQIAKYTAALDAADIDLASQVWRTSADVSFIHPAG